MYFLETRFNLPLQEGELMTRVGVAKVLEAAGNRRNIVVSAPAGYGKTSALVQLYRRLIGPQDAAVWLSLYDFNGSWEEVARYLNHGLVARAGFYGSVLPEGLSATEAQTALCNSLASTSATVFIFLDDLDAIFDTPAEQFVNGLIKRSGPNIRWIMSCRGSPKFEFARMRAQGQLLEIETDALRFSDHETRQMLSLVSQRDVSSELGDVAHKRTEGWPAGVQLVSIALAQSTNEAALLKRFSGETRDVSEFFYEEVFVRLDEGTRSFLLSTGILGRFCHELCDAVTERQASRTMIRKIQSLGLFIFSLDAEQKWYRYHHLFAEFLTRLLHELHPELVPMLHLRASDWFFTKGLIAEAIPHAFRSGDLTKAAELLDKSWHSLNAVGVFSMAERWAAAIPQGILDTFPGVQLWRAWYLMCERRFGEARPLLQAVSDKLDQLEADGSGDAHQVREWRRALLHRQLMLAQYSDDPVATERRYSQLLEAGCSKDGLVLATTELALLYARREQYELKDIEALGARALDLCQGSGKESSLLWHSSTLGPALVMKGQTGAAVALYQDAIELGSRIDSDNSALRAMPVLLLAELQLERNRLDEAHALFDKAVELGTSVGLVDHLIANYVGRARLAAFEGDEVTAQKLLGKGFSIGVAKGLDRLRCSVTHERIRLALVRGDAEQAKHVARESETSLLLANLHPGTTVTSRDEVNARAAIRLAIALGAPHEALQLSRRWSAFFSGRGAVQSELRFYLLSARAQQAEGNTRAALRTIRHAIVLAAPADLYFCFLEEGEPIRSLVTKALEIEAIPDDLRAFAACFHSTVALQRSTPASPRPPGVESGGERAEGGAAVLIEPLTGREIEILRYVSRSLLNKEIADKLGLTEGSVKWYLQQIYGKLGVRRRMGALEKARLLGYLP